MPVSCIAVPLRIRTRVSNEHFELSQTKWCHFDKQWTSLLDAVQAQGRCAVEMEINAADRFIRRDADPDQFGY